MSSDGNHYKRNSAGGGARREEVTTGCGFQHRAGRLNTYFSLEWGRREFYHVEENDIDVGDGDKEWAMFPHGSCRTVAYRGLPAVGLKLGSCSHNVRKRLECGS